MTRTAHARAQAKVNLGLRILARDASGYHALETLFHQLELADEVRVERTAGERVLLCSGPAFPAGGLGPARDNLAWRAADAYARAAGWSGGFSIELVKHIPAGGGLGGGSSDAGAVLRACERLADVPLGPARIRELAASLGSDVPFLAGEAAAAVGTGRGESLDPVPALPRRAVALVFPPFGVSTKDAYGWLALSRSGLPAVGPAATGVGRPSWDALARHAANDFEAVVGARHPEIPATLDALRRAGARLALMSGSGSTLFGIFDDADVAAARAALTGLAPGASVTWTHTAQCVVPVELSG